MSHCQETQPCCCHCQHGVSTDESCARCVDLCGTTDTRCHVAPEPIEAPEPQREERRRDLVREEALRPGTKAMLRRGMPLSEAFRSGVEAYEAHLARHDYRGRAHHRSAAEEVR
jgi:predicted nuclease with RNAse H fold